MPLADGGLPYRPGWQIIHTLSEEALGLEWMRAAQAAGAGNLTWTANLAIFIPFGVSEPFLVREVFWLNNATVTGNIDLGVYDTAGTLLFSTGSTAQGSASVVQSSSGLADYTLPPGDYYLAFALDSATANLIYGWTPTLAQYLAAVGVGSMADAFPLPSSATIVPTTTSLLPYVGLNGYTVAP